MVRRLLLVLTPVLGRSVSADPLIDVDPVILEEVVDFPVEEVTPEPVHRGGQLERGRIVVRGKVLRHDVVRRLVAAGRRVRAVDPEGRMAEPGNGASRSLRELAEEALRLAQAAGDPAGDLGAPVLALGARAVGPRCTQGQGGTVAAPIANASSPSAATLSPAARAW